MNTGTRREPTWVLLRGLTRERGHWGDFPERLHERLPAGSRVAAPDLPGNGERHEQRSQASIPAMRVACSAQLRERGVEPPYVLLAMSMGAMLAADWASAEPDAVAGCVLINTSLRPFSPWYRRLRPANYARLLRLAFATTSAAERERMILRMTSRRFAVRSPEGAGIVEAWARLRESHPVSRFNALRQLIAAARYRAPLRAPAVPVLVLTSERDALVDTRCSQRLAEGWRTEIAQHPAAGHDLPLDDPQWVIEQATAWWRRVSAA